MGLNSSLDVIRAQQGLQLNYGDIAGRIQVANLVDTLIEAIYEVDGERYCLSTTFDPLSGTVASVHTLDGVERPMTADAITADFPVRLYSWSEMRRSGAK